MRTLVPMRDHWRVNRSQTRIALAGVVIAAPTLLTLLPGDWFDESGEGMTRNVEPPDLPLAIHVSVAVLAGALLVTSLLVLLSPAGRSITSRHDIPVAAPLLLVGLYVAFTYRVATAAVSGANIGAGLLFMLGVVAVPPLLVLAGYKAWRTQHSTPL